MERFLRLMRWLTAIAAVLMLVLLAWQCIDIYSVGNSPANLDASGLHLQNVYRMDDVVERLRRLSVPLVACVLLIALTALLHLVFSKNDSQRPKVSSANILRLRKQRIAELPEAAKREERFRLCVKGVAAFLILLCAVVSMTYLLNSTHFTSWDLESVMGNMMLHVGPWCAFAFLIAIGASLLCGRSVEREIASLKGCPLSKEAPAAKKERSSTMLQIGLYVLAAVFIVLGVMNGGWYDVLVKAINICTECIGLG